MKTVPENRARGAPGSVSEVYLIQELNRKFISRKGKAFIRLGYQYYKFDYTGSNNWVGAPVVYPMCLRIRS